MKLLHTIQITKVFYVSKGLYLLQKRVFRPSFRLVMW